MKKAFPYRLYLVLSEQSCVHHDCIQVAEQAVAGGVDIVQLREKNVSKAVLMEKALRLQEVLSKYHVPLIINDDLEIAQAVNAFGIHVGNNDRSPTYIRAAWASCQSLGYSIETLEQVCNAEAMQSDYLGISPVFSTPTKTDTITEWGLAGVQQIRALTEKPLVAIGRMNADNAYEVIRAGADTIAVVSAICGATHPMKAAFEIRNQIEKAL